MAGILFLLNHFRKAKCCDYRSVIILLLFLSSTNCFIEDFAAKPQNIAREINPIGNAAIPSKKVDTVIHDITLYLTFDDGPAEGSENINKIVISDSVYINVFVIGRNVFMDSTRKRYFESYRNNPLIETGNHSFTHANNHYLLYYKDPGQVIKDFELNTDTLKLDNEIARLPGRNTWRIKGRSRSDLPDANAAADSLAGKGYSIFGWDIEWRYYSDSSNYVQPADSLVKLIEQAAMERRTFIKGNIVILCHDHVFSDPVNVAQLRLFIKKIRESKVYRFEHLSKYPQ